MSALLGIFVGPVLGSVVDAFGPRSTLLLSAACSTLRPIVFLALPNVAGLESAREIAHPCSIRA